MKFAPLIGEFDGHLYELKDDIMMDLNSPVVENGQIQPYPAGFAPTFHRYRLDEPQKLKKPAKIFVCSMADLFGTWVPDEWIWEVFKVVRNCPQHTFMFLTKNPKRYRDLVKDYYNPVELPKNAFYGTTLTKFEDKHKAMWLPHPDKRKTFVSIEPLLGHFGDIMRTHWVIIGAQTGPGAKQPKSEWVQNIIDQCRAAGVPVFLKNNLNWPEKIQEWPEELQR
jgi:protein gp37